ncbi:hypothetical protein QTP88_023591 [Uroleucon formosanum]
MSLHILKKLKRILDESDLDPDYISITEHYVEQIEEDLDKSDLDPHYIPITEHYVEQVEEDLDDSNFDPDLTPITEHQDNQLIEAARKKKKFSPADKKAVLEVKSELKNVNAKTKHPNRSLTCPVRCKKKCRDNLSTDHQKFLWKTYFSLTTYVQRRQFLAKCVTITSVKRRTTVEGSVDSSKKSQFRVYKLPDSKKNEVQVCKTTLLNVGYTNDSVLTELVKNMNRNFYMSSENRGQQNIKKMLYKPSVSHYRRLNAPNILYLPFGLTVKAMYNDFCSQHKNYCSQEFYRQVIKDLNISLINPTIDKCEYCSSYQNIIENSTDENEIRDNITLLENHKAKALATTSKYKEDSKLNIESTYTKSSFFTSRLVVFNETFAQLKPNALCHCVLWHEAIAGQLKDFYEWKNKKRTTNVKTDTLYGFKMNSVVMAKFSRGSTCMEYWTDFNGEPKTLDFLPKNFFKDIKIYYLKNYST